MDIKPIKTDADYQATLKEVESLMLAKAGSPEGEKLDAMVTLMKPMKQSSSPQAYTTRYRTQKVPLIKNVFKWPTKKNSVL